MSAQDAAGNGNGDVQTDELPKAVSKPQKVVKKAGISDIKQEFLLLNYVPRLHEEYLSSASKSKISQSEPPPKGEGESGLKRKQEPEEEGTEVKSAHSENDKNPSKKIKLKGRNKHRPNTFRTDDSKKMCPAILGERECQFGEKCKFCHDVAVYVKNKPEDIGEECHNFKTFGKCPYGFACRFSKHHITSDYKNITDQELFEKMASQPQVQNTLTKDLQHLLWKKKYDFSKANKIVDSYYDDLRKNQAGEQPSGKSAASVSVGDDDGRENSKPVGCVTDEEEIRLKPREKKLIDFSNKLYLAPLTTVGNLPFRRLCKRFGADVTCGEMAMATNLLQGQQSEWALLKRHPSEDIFGVQICGSYPDSMTRCAQLLQEKTNVDFIDINSGCPIDLVYKKGEGCALMGKATKYENIVRCMTSVLDVPLTVKMRTGIADGKNTAHSLIPRLREAGVSLVTIHGRSREQRYTRQADWDYIKRCAEVAAPMPLFGNGDILSYEDANRHKEASGVSGLMIARGALIKPWIFTEIKEQRHWDISSAERLDMLRDYCNYGLEYWGSDTKGVETTRRFLLEWLSFLCRYIPVGVLAQPPQKINERPPHYRGRDDLETMMASSNCADWIKISEMLLGPVPPEFNFLPKHKANAYQ
ncbi:tRNA-dihydrouridine(47) synthase [NAD(P)(+)]-like [Babylonia areolata]|uniref:tRNA-dihydrouridine(47) synthase [NAD(P)(+)]-like n=1 Tax=Babylonia areolata TaxID=304850 RepID=UPI003FCF5412